MDSMSKKAFRKSPPCMELILNPHSEKHLPSFDAKACKGRIRHGTIKGPDGIISNKLYKSLPGPEKNNWTWKYQRNVLKCREGKRFLKNNPDALRHFDAMNCPGREWTKMDKNKNLYVSAPVNPKSDEYSWIPARDYRKINDHYRHMKWEPVNCFSDLSSGHETLFDENSNTRRTKTQN